jgi:two-component system, NarL family, sensor histidine kinase DesK
VGEPGGARVGESGGARVGEPGGARVGEPGGARVGESGGARVGESGGNDLRPALNRALFGQQAFHSLAGRGGGLLWLAFVLIPLINAIGRHGPALERGLTIAGSVAFIGAYMALVLTWRRGLGQPLAVALFVVLLALAIAMTAGDRPGWGFLFVYCSVCAGLIFPPPWGFVGVVGCSVMAGGTSAVAGGGAGTSIGVSASSAGIGVMMLVLRDLRLRNQELTEARAELAQLAVARERERFARDLHDLLGHTLSVITLKTELAGRLLPDRADEARAEIAEVEQVARGALSEVRDAVSGYRQPTLDGELAGARLALSSAGITAEVDRDEVRLDPAVEAVLSWAVREGATNVIRHSGASRCSVRVRAGLAEASVEVIDNGHGPASPSGPGPASLNGPGAASPNGPGPASPNRAGHGLEGLAERARAMHGHVEAGPLDVGGFRLAVTVPVVGLAS